MPTAICQLISCIRTELLYQTTSVMSPRAIEKFVSRKIKHVVQLLMIVYNVTLYRYNRCTGSHDYTR